MLRKRVNELAKEWGLDPKDVVARLERAGVKGKKPQSTLTDEEIDRAKGELGLVDKPSIAVGDERLVTGSEGQTVLEKRVGTGVIRRRAAARVDAPASDAPVFEAPSTSEATFESFPPTEALDDLALPVAPEPELPAPPHEVKAAPVAAKPPAPTKPEPVVVRPSSPPTRTTVIVPRATEAPRPHIYQRPNAPPPRAALPTTGTQSPASTPDAPRGPRILGRIDLSKIKPPAPAPAPAQRPGVAARGPARPAAGPRDVNELIPPPPPGEGDRPRKKKRRVINKPETGEPSESDRRRGKLPRKKRVLPGKELRKTEITVPRASKRVVRISEVITVGELAKAMGAKAGEVVKKLMDAGMMATINQVLDLDTATLIASEFEYNIENVAFNADTALEEGHEQPQDDHLVPRSPVVTIMGHVDHGKTSLLDAIRKTNVTEQEAGGITQHIGAYQVEVHGRSVTFLDTPGHEAFTAMRARGAKVTDIVVLVVAADDGVMPQTAEAINHARAAEVPIIVAINKIDKPDANLERTRQSLSEYGLVSEEWGGDTTVVPVSAKTQEGIPQLLDMLLLQADVLELKANPDKLARGTIVEAKLDRGRGPVATVLVQEGTLKIGDPFVCGGNYGRVRAMIDDKGNKIDVAGPSTPVEILGLQGVPEAGSPFVAVADEATARQVAEHRRGKQREAELVKTAKVSLEDLYNRIQAGDVKELRVVLKADVQGSVEAISQALLRLSADEVRLNVLHSSVGGITESDVLLASASNAIVIGFNIRPESKANAVAEREGVEIRLYTIIYDAVNEIREAMEGLLEPMFKEKTVGRAEVRQVFTVPSVGLVAGSFVIDGKITRNGPVRLVRDHVVVYTGKLTSLRRFKEDAREVSSGYECGIGLENYQDVKVGDVVEAFELERVVRRLTQTATKGAGAERRA